MKNKLYGAAGPCVLLACIFADGKRPWLLLAAMATAVLLVWAAERAPVKTAKRLAGPHERRARARRRGKMVIVLAVLTGAALGSSWTVHKAGPGRTLPDVTELATMLNSQKCSPGEIEYNTEDWPELERVFKSGMDAKALARELSPATVSEAAAAQFTEDWPELAYLLNER